MEYENVGVKAKSKQEYCAICQEPVYRNDRLDLGKFILHEQCFRCLKCGLKLTNSNFATYGDALLCKAHYHQLFQKKGNYTELARTGRYTISGSTERLIENGDITEEEAKQMLLIQAEVDNMVQERRSSNKVEDEDYARGRSYQNDEVMQQEEEEGEQEEDDAQAYSYSYGGNYRYNAEYDEEEEEEEEEQRGYSYRRQYGGGEEEEEEEYQNKLDWFSRVRFLQVYKLQILTSSQLGTLWISLSVTPVYIGSELYQALKVVRAPPYIYRELLFASWFINFFFHQQPLGM